MSAPTVRDFTIQFDEDRNPYVEVAGARVTYIEDGARYVHLVDARVTYRQNDAGRSDCAIPGMVFDGLGLDDPMHPADYALLLAAMSALLAHVDPSGTYRTGSTT